MSACPKCGCEVEDPFLGKVPIHDVARCSFAAPAGSETSDVRLYREDNVWHVWIDGEHVAECCDFSFVTALDRLKTRLSPNDRTEPLPPETGVANTTTP